MKWIRDTSLRKKLIVGFVTINILLVTIGVLGTLGIRSVSNNSALMYDEYLQSVDDLHQIKANLLHADIVLQHIKQSDQYVSGIQSVVGNVGTAFTNLSMNAQDILDFIDDNVGKDYDLLIDTGERYERDAVFFDGISQETAAMAEELNASTEEISSVIMNIAGNMDHASSNSNQVISGMEETIIALGEIAAAAESQAETAERLNQLIHVFKI